MDLVEWCAACPATEWVRIYRRSQGGIMQGEPWDTIKVDIKATVASALAVISP